MFMLPFGAWLSLIGEYANGATDAPNVIGPLLASKVIKYRWAILIAVVCNMIGAFFGKRVAETIGKGMVDTHIINSGVIAAAILASIVWSIVAWVRRYGISKSHTLYAGLLGAGLAFAGPKAIIGFTGHDAFIHSGWFKVLAGLGLAFVIGTPLGALVTFIYHKIVPDPQQRNPPVSRWLLIISSAGIGLLHGTNDAQKYMGLITISLMQAGLLKTFTIPLWVVILCSIVMGIGTLSAGTGIARRFDEDFNVTKLYTALITSVIGIVLLGFATDAGIPQSTTHTIICIGLGCGAVAGYDNIKRKSVGENALMWALTYLVPAVLAALFVRLFCHQ